MLSQVYIKVLSERFVDRLRRGGALVRRKLDLEDSSVRYRVQCEGICAVRDL